MGKKEARRSEHKKSPSGEGGGGKVKMEKAPIPAMIYGEKDGLYLVNKLYSGIVGRSERQATATYLVDTLSREELIKFIERMLLGIEMIKNRERKRP